ncbi:MAG: Uma2 family endonuclease, partial [Actinobacteria bacterium]|nr:Uma2 family endonuclease [Actinomycetota bacterium]
VMAQTAPAAYTVEDLDWLRAELGVARLELDPWGSLIVTPANDAHEMAVALLHDQAVRQLRLPRGHVFTGIAWKVEGGSGYLNVPDLTVLDAGWRRVGDLALDPAPLLVVEVASPSTRRADRGRKLADYRLGGASCYVLVDLPAAEGDDAVFEVHDFLAPSTTAANLVDVVVGGEQVRFDLSDLLSVR